MWVPEKAGGEKAFTRGAPKVLLGCATSTRLRHLHPPPPFLKVGFGGARGAVRLRAVHPGPGLLQQHGVQRSEAAHLHTGSPKSHPQRANDSMHMDLVLRDQNVPASDQQGLFWCRPTVGSHQAVRIALGAAEASG